MTALERVMKRLEEALETRKEKPENYCEGVTDGIRRAYRVVEEEAKRGDWIPCSERLPEKHGLYDVTWQDKETGDRGTAEVFFDDTAGDAGEFEPLSPCVKIIAWKPRPQPWEGGVMEYQHPDEVLIPYRDAVYELNKLSAIRTAIYEKLKSKGARCDSPREWQEFYDAQEKVNAADKRFERESERYHDFLYNLDSSWLCYVQAFHRKWNL